MARLPSAYQEVEWIEGNGTQYIKTGFTTTLTMKIEVDATCVNSSCVIGTIPINGSTNSNFTIGKYNSTVAYLCWNGQEIGGENWSGRSTMTGYQDDTKVYRIYNGTTTSANIVNSTISTPSELWMFRRNSPGGGDGGGAKIYSCKIYDNNILVREFVPCYRISDNEIGMYDTVNDVFYTNQGTGTFTKGPSIYTFPDFRAVKNFYIPQSRLPEEYQEVEYIENSSSSSTSGQYIDTLFIPTVNTKVVLETAITGVESAAHWAEQGSAKSGYMFCIGCHSDRFVISLNSYDSIQSESITYGRKYIFELSAIDKTVKIYDTVSETYVVDGSTASYNGSSENNNFYLFRYNGGSSQYCPAKVYSCKIYDNNVLVRDLVPCYRKSDSVIGLYDSVNNTFYTNAGTGTFTKGDDVYPDVEVKKIEIQTSTPRLPLEYQEVEYIESNSNYSQRIDSGVMTYSGHTYTQELEVMVTTTPSGGATISGNDCCATIEFNGSSTWQNIEFLNTWRKVKGDRNLGGDNHWTTWIDDVQYGPSTVAYTQNYNIYLFCSCFGSPFRYISAKAKYFKIWADGTLIRDMVPCYRKSDSVIGMYDLVNDVFYTNKGSDSFAKGNDVTTFPITLWEKSE